MSAIKRQQLMNQTGFTKIDNKLFDAQPFLSPAAFSMMMRMCRMTDGYNEDDSNLSNSYLQKICNMSKNTVSKCIGELVDFGFLIAKKQHRKTTIYELNHENISRFNGKEYGQNLVSQYLGTQNMTIPFPKSDQVNSQKLGRIKDNYKDNSLNKTLNNAPPKKEAPKAKKKSAPKADTTTVEKPEPVSQQVWDDLLTLRKTKRAPLTQTAWNMALKEILIAQKATGHPMDQIISEWIVAGWVGFKSDWYANRAGSKPAIDRKTDKLAVNNNWENASQPTEIKSTVTFEEFMGEAQ